MNTLDKKFESAILELSLVNEGGSTFIEGREKLQSACTTIAVEHMKGFAEWINSNEYYKHEQNDYWSSTDFATPDCESTEKLVHKFISTLK